MSHESELKRQLAEIQQRYKAEAQPIIDELVAIEMAKPPVVFVPLFDVLEGANASISIPADVLDAAGKVHHWLRNTHNEGATINGICLRDTGMASSARLSRMTFTPPAPTPERP